MQISIGSISCSRARRDPSLYSDLSDLAVARSLARAAAGRVQLGIGLALELLVQDAGCCAISSGPYATKLCEQKFNLLRTSYPNWGYSRHSPRNSGSASARRVCDRFAQKFATGARMVVSASEV